MRSEPFETTFWCSQDIIAILSLPDRLRFHARCWRPSLACEVTLACILASHA